MSHFSAPEMQTKGNVRIWIMPVELPLLMNKTLSTDTVAKHFTKFALVIMKLLIAIFILASTKASSIEFNRKLTGIHFNPYVKSASDSRLRSCLNQYTFHELKTMLEIVATKFSRVATNTVDASNVPYLRNGTYYNDACIVARTAEAAAVINRERKNKSLTVLIGVEKYSNELGGDNRTATEINVALEAEQIANGIYLGTVEGFQISADPTFLTDSIVAKSGFRWLMHLKQQTKGQSLRIGLLGLERKSKSIILHQAFNSIFNSGELKMLLSNADFLNVKYFPNENAILKGPIIALKSIGNLFLSFRPQINLIYPTLELMGSSGWPSEGNSTRHNIYNLVDYWKQMNDYATKNNIPIWIDQAFDNPINNHYVQDFPHLGWWRLTKDELAGNASGYQEKYFDSLEHKESHHDSLFWFSIAFGITTGTMIIMLLSGLVVRIYKKVNSLKESLTNEDITVFMHGSTYSPPGNNEDDEGYDGLACESAMRKPYDQSLEIPKDMLEIYWDKILGMGQFGCVFKALWKSEPPQNIALKTTRRHCPAAALRGILYEIKTLAHLGQHPNIVSICGAYTAELGNGKVYLATELCTMGSLKSYLIQLKITATGSTNYENMMGCQNDMIRWSLEIASGMEHVESMRVVHADLAIRNVLLSADGIAKISDFGLSRRLYEYSEYVKNGQEPLPWRSMAIESLKRMTFSHKSDVWSYGVTLWEIFSKGTEPYPGLSWNVDFVDRLEDGLRLKRPSLATPALYGLMLECWHSHPEMRPSFRELKMKILNNKHLMKDEISNL